MNFHVDGGAAGREKEEGKKRMERGWGETEERQKEGGRKGTKGWRRGMSLWGCAGGQPDLEILISLGLEEEEGEAGSSLLLSRRCGAKAGAPLGPVLTQNITKYTVGSGYATRPLVGRPVPMLASRADVPLDPGQGTKRPIRGPRAPRQGQEDAWTYGRGGARAWCSASWQNGR